MAAVDNHKVSEGHTPEDDDGEFLSRKITTLAVSDDRVILRTECSDVNELIVEKFFR